MKGQKKVLGNINDGIQSLAESFAEFNKEASIERLNRRERERDEQQRNKQQQNNPKSPGGGFGGGGGSPFSGLGIGAGFGLAGVASMATAGAKRLIAPALLMSAADDVADYLEKNGTDKEGADAVGRAIQAGGAGLIFGKKAAIAGAFVGAMLTKENQEKLKELGTSFQERGVEIKEYLKELNVTLPSVGDVMKSMAEGFGGILEFSNSIVKGEFKQAFDAFGEASKPIVFAMAANKASKAVKNIPKGELKNPAQMSKGDRRIKQSAFAKNMTEKQIKNMADQGVIVDTKNGTFKNSKGKFMSVDAVSGAMNKAGIKDPSIVLKKYPRLALLKRLPIVGGLATIGGISSILANDDMSEKEKLTQVAGMLGGIGAASLGGILGGLVGAAAGGGIGSLITGGIGSIAGAIGMGYLGDEAAQMLVAKALMGNDTPITDFAKSLGLIRDTSTPAPTMIDEFGGSMDEYTNPKPKIIPSRKASYQTNALTGVLSDRMGIQTAPNYVIMDNSSTNQNNVSNNTSGGAFTGNPNPWDYGDPMDATR